DGYAGSSAYSIGTGASLSSSNRYGQVQSLSSTPPGCGGSMTACGTASTWIGSMVSSASPVRIGLATLIWATSGAAWQASVPVTARLRTLIGLALTPAKVSVAAVRLRTESGCRQT